MISLLNRLLPPRSQKEWNRIFDLSFSFLMAEIVLLILWLAGDGVLTAGTIAIVGALYAMDGLRKQ